jgi:capsule polysaccharide export protein KpsE/RkpR
LDNLIDLQLSQPSPAQLIDSVQQERFRERNDEFDRLRIELAASHKKIFDCEAMSVQQLSLFEAEISRKTGRVEDLEQQLAECQRHNDATAKGPNIQDTQHVRGLEALREQLQTRISTQQGNIVRLLAEKEATMQENTLLQRQLSASAEENESLLAQIDSSDVFGADYGNSSLGAPPREDDPTCHDLCETIDRKEAYIKTLEEKLEVKHAVIGDLQARTKLADTTVSSLEATIVTDQATLKELREVTNQKDTTIKNLRTIKDEITQRLRQIQENRHIELVYDVFDKIKHVRELDIEKIFQVGVQEQRHSDIATILGSMPVPPHFIHVTILDVDADAGVRSVMTKVPIDKEYTVKALLNCLRKPNRNYGLYLTWPDRTKSSVMSRVLTHQPNDATGFVEACQQQDARVFFGHYEHFSQFFEKYKAAYLRDQVISSNKRVGGSLEKTGKRAAPSLSAHADNLPPNTSSEDEEM